jgi:glycosyltransferase involved in cell wall biosynthesis
MTEEISKPLRVCLIADMLEEHYPSMDLFPEMLNEFLPRADCGITTEVFRLPLRKRFGRVLGFRLANSADRILGRHVDYRRGLAKHPRADIYHVLDHSYAALVNSLPASKTVVTCHDRDSFRVLLPEEWSFKSPVLRPLARMTYSGLESAARIVCDSTAVSRELIEQEGFPASQISVIPPGVHPVFLRETEPSATIRVDALLGPRNGPEFLHVGSTVQRKRIDTVLHAFAGVRRARPDARLIRLGGPFTAEQAELLSQLHLQDSVTVLPFLDRPAVAAVYRRADLVMIPSEREGFGLPLIESLSTGTPVLARHGDTVCEVGGTAVEYVHGDDPERWSTAALALLSEKENSPAEWRARSEAGIARSHRFTWEGQAKQLAALYRTIA